MTLDMLTLKNAGKGALAEMSGSLAVMTFERIPPKAKHQTVIREQQFKVRSEKYLDILSPRTCISV